MSPTFIIIIHSTVIAIYQLLSSLIHVFLFTLILINWLLISINWLSTLISWLLVFRNWLGVFINCAAAVAFIIHHYVSLPASGEAAASVSGAATETESAAAELALVWMVEITSVRSFCNSLLTDLNRTLSMEMKILNKKNYQ